MKMKKMLVLLLMLTPVLAFTQSRDVEKLLSVKPYSINYKHEVQSYRVTLKWQNLDAINGNKFNCNTLKANFTAGLPGDSVRWNNVQMGSAEDFNQKEFDGKELPELNNFTYKGVNMDFLRLDFYKNIPAEHIDIARWLVSDAIQMQGLAWYVFDSLEYRKEFIPKVLTNTNIKFQNWVAFSSRYQKLTWNSIAEFNNEICAVIQFESLYNPLEIENPSMKLKGRSLYWGEMWISLKDKQVEYAIMYEDVVFKLKSDNFPQEQLIDLQRVVNFEKVKP
jgi:hypothetical protein